MSVSTLRKSQLNSDLRIQQIYGEDYEKVDGVYEELLTKYAKYDEPYIPEGFTHIGTADWNSGYQIKETATGNIFVWVPCVLDQTKVKDGDKVETFKRTLPTTTDTTDPYYMYSNNLTIIGDERAFVYSVRNNYEIERKTTLKERMISLMNNYN